MPTTPVSNWNDLLVGTYNVVSGLSLATTNGTPVTVITGKVPKKEADIVPENLPLIYVTCSGRPVRSVWNTTADPRANGLNTKLNTYIVELTRIAAGNLDNTAGLPDYLSWQQICVRAVAGSPTEVTVTGQYSELYEVNYDEDPPIDRPAWYENYDVSALHISFEVVEPCQGTG
jgi:hypothetical protein